MCAGWDLGCNPAARWQIHAAAGSRSVSRCRYGAGDLPAPIRWFSTHVDETGDATTDDGADEMASRVGDLLHLRGWTLAVAESLTGGLLVRALARVEGSGDWLLGGIVACARSVHVPWVSTPTVVCRPAAAIGADGSSDVDLGADLEDLS